MADAGWTHGHDGSCFVFAADLLRNVTSPTVCHFVQQVGTCNGEHARREGYLAPGRFEGRDALVLDAVRTPV
jgi:hypothetical protein